MVLAMNIGNTNFTVGLIIDGKITAIRYPIKIFKSKKFFIMMINKSLLKLGISNKSITGTILASVNPSLTSYLENAVINIFSFRPIIVNALMNMKLNLSYYDTTLIGSDRIAICEAAISKYKMPVIVFDLGTATTINVIDNNSYFLGGSILPGLKMGIDALAKGTAQLSQSNLEHHKALLGLNTNECILSGAIFGTATMIDGMVKHIEKRLSQKSAVIITGGNSKYIIPVCNTEITYEPELLIEGLYILYKHNI